MNKQEHILTIVGEECAEIAQRASKCARFGMDEVQPGQDQNNKERLIGEVMDLLGALELLLQPEGSVAWMIDLDLIAKRRPQIEAKRRKICQFLEYSKSCGTLA